MHDKEMITKLEKTLGYRFKNKELIDNALRHSSYVNEQPDQDLSDNECMEFLGDAVLNLVIGHILFDKFPFLKEGALSRMRANLVNETQLAFIAKSIELGQFLHLGKGEIQTHGREKNSILSDAVEAVIAAVYMDDGFDTAFTFIKRLYTDLVEEIGSPVQINDSKSLLQEFTQTSMKIMPIYKVIGESGPDHSKTFKIQVNVRDFMTEGVGKSKKSAEQDAAKNALEKLKEQSEKR